MTKIAEVKKLKIALKPKQREVLDACSDPEVMYVIPHFARQRGKSTVARLQSIKWLTEPNVFVGFVTQTYKLASLFYDNVLRYIPAHWILKANASEHSISLVNGSQMQFFSAEKANNIRGFTFDYLIWDEVAFCREYTSDGQHLWNNILSPMLVVKGKKVMFLSTPNGSQGFYYQQYTKAKSGQKGYALIECTIFDDDTISVEKINEIKAEISQKSWEQEYLCKFLDNGASYFADFQCLFDLDAFDATKKQWFGIDFSTTGDDNTIVTFINDEGSVEQHVITGSLDLKYNRIANLINSRADLIQAGYAESNSIGTPMYNEINKLLSQKLRARFFEYLTTNASKNNYIDTLALDIDKKNIHFSKKNIALNEELKTFTYKLGVSGKKQFGALPGFHDDRVISLALANMAKHEKAVRSGSIVYTFKRNNNERF